MFHKICRKAALTLHNSEEGKAHLKKLMKVFKFAKAPFGSGRFGQQILHARKALLKGLRQGECMDLFEMWAAGIEKDLGKSPVDVHDLCMLLERGCRAWS